MKKNINLLIFSLLAIPAIQAQNYTDALRYSTETLSGTARFKAMSGAFGALGGDLSAININPAGSAVFSSGEFGLTFGNDSEKREVSFTNLKTNRSEADFNINQYGMVFVIPEISDTWKKISLSFNYQKTKNFDVDKLYYLGQGNVGLDSYFQYFAQKGNINGTAFSFSNFRDLYYNTDYQSLIGEDYISLRDSNAQAAYLGLLSELIVPQSTSPSETNYNLNSNGAIRSSKNEAFRSGYTHKYNFNIASQFGDDVFLGLNLNSHSVNENTIYSVSENNFGNNSKVRYANHQRYVNTTGGGFSFQLGAIAKVTESLRLGVTYSSPTWYNLEEQSREVLYATISNTTTYDRDIDLFNRYGDPIWYEREYSFRSPSSWTASAAYVFGKKGLISVDYIYKNYGNIHFSTDYLQGENNIVQNELGEVNILRIGAEYRIKALSLRGGFRYEQSPYRKLKEYGDINGYSFGAGYSFGGIRLDISYDIAHQNNAFKMYEVVLTNPAAIKLTRSNLLFTLSAKLF